MTAQDALFDLATPIEEWLEDAFEEVGWRDFYRDLFPQGEFEEKGVFTPGKYNGVAVQVARQGGREQAKRFTVTDDLDVIGQLVEDDDFCIMSPVSYAGKTQKQDMARFLYAITIDLDGIKMVDECPVGLDNMWYQMTSIRDTAAADTALPLSTYIVSSGRGVHLYYLLKRPVPLFRNVVKQLSRMRHALIKDIWNQYITDLSKNKQFESVTQAFRMVGSITKDGRRVRAFRTGERVSIDYLNAHIRDEASHLTQFAYKSELTLAQAKEKYPDWYERRVVQGQPRSTWTTHRGLYEWWKRKINIEAREGHRYFCIMALAMYGRKSGIDRSEVERDALALIPRMNQIGSEDNPFTVEDVMKALEAHDASYQTFPRHNIEALTAIPIPPNKRNGRSRLAHITRQNQIFDLDVRSGDPERRGRPKKRDMIRQYARDHPDANHSQIARALGVSRPTVIKWLRVSDDEVNE